MEIINNENKSFTFNINEIKETYKSDGILLNQGAEAVIIIINLIFVIEIISNKISGKDCSYQRTIRKKISRERA